MGVQLSFFMSYFSQLLKTPVTDSADSVAGKLKDILISAEVGAYNPLRFLVIRAKDGTEAFVPYEYVASISRSEIALGSQWAKIPRTKPEGNYIFLKRDVLDQQIVDVEGARVVRVNDLKIGLFENKMCVLGIDVSFKGIFRRLGIAALDWFDLFKVNLIDWRKAQLVKGALKLNIISKDLTRLHPADLANIVESLTVKHGSRLVRSLAASDAAHVLEELDPETQKTLVNYLGPDRAAKIMQEMSIDETVDLLQMMPRDQARKFLAALQGNKLQRVKNLIQYDKNTAGGLMTTDFVAARPDWTVAQAIGEVRRLSPTLRSIIHVYITDHDGYFKGSVSLRGLLVANSEQPLKDLMKRFPKRSTLRLDQSIKEVVRVMTKYDLYTAAVTDRENKLAGVVTIDDVMRHLVPRA